SSGLRYGGRRRYQRVFRHHDQPRHDRHGRHHYRHLQRCFQGRHHSGESSPGVPRAQSDAGSTGTVTLAIAAPVGGARVSLTSSNASTAAVPASVTVAAGATSATFAITTSRVTTDGPQEGACSEHESEVKCASFQNLH